MTTTFSRRALLRSLAGAGVALPLLTSFARPSRAQAASFPVRFIAFFHPNGVQPEGWFPTSNGAPTNFTLNRAHQALGPFQDKIVVTSGINMSVTSLGFGEPHQRGMGAVLTGRENAAGNMVGGDGTTCGWNLGTSVDQIIAQRVGSGVRFSSLELGVRADVSSATGEIRNRCIYAGPQSPLSPENNPSAVWNRVFAGAAGTVEARAAERAQRRSILDAVAGNLSAVQAQISSDEREKLEQHLTLVRDLERRLTSDASPGASCVLPAAPADIAVDDENTMQQVSRLQIDQLVMAMACDLTRVGSIQYSNALNHIRFPWLSYRNDQGESMQSLGDGHGLSHDQGGTQHDVDEEWIVRDAWYAGEFAYLLSRLAAIPEGGGSMLDNVVILWVNELALGNSHSHSNMPFVIAGGGGGRIATGQYLAFDDEPHNNLLLAILHAFGSDDASFGHPDHCTRPLPGLLR